MRNAIRLLLSLLFVGLIAIGCGEDTNNSLNGNWMATTNSTAAGGGTTAGGGTGGTATSPLNFTFTLNQNQNGGTGTTAGGTGGTGGTPVTVSNLTFLSN